MCYCLQRYLKLNVFTNLRTLFRIFQYNFSSKKSVCNKIVRFFSLLCDFSSFSFRCENFRNEKNRNMGNPYPSKAKHGDTIR